MEQPPEKQRPWGDPGPRYGSELDWLIGLLPTGKCLVHIFQPGVVVEVKVQVDSLDQLSELSTVPADYWHLGRAIQLEKYVFAHERYTTVWDT